MYKFVLAIVGLVSLCDIFTVFFCRTKKYSSIKWTVVSILTGGILLISWLILGIVFKTKPLWVNYIMATGYVLFTLLRITNLIEIKIEEEILKSRRFERTFFYDPETAMFRKKNEETFDDGRQLYCASSLLLIEKHVDEKINDNN